MANNDPKDANVDLTKLTKSQDAPRVPEDPATGEPQDEKPIYYRAKSRSVIMDDGSNVQEAIDNIKGDLESHTHDAAEIITDPDHRFVSDAEKDYWNSILKR